MAAGRTALFKKLKALMREAQYLQRNPDMKNFVSEAKEAKQYSRRDFLKMMGWAGIGTAGSALLLPKSFAQGAAGSLANLPRSASGAVAIVGGGSAGLTTAYRLMKAGVACEIFEASTRTGGRMFTNYNCNSDGMFCEMGGELVDSNHTDLIELAAELTADGFPVHIQPIKEGDKGKDLYYVNGKYFFDDDILEMCGPLIEAIALARKDIYVHKDGEETEDYNYDTAKKWDDMSIAEFFTKHCGNVDKNLIKALDIAYKGEYGLPNDQQSALNLLTFIDPKAYKNDEGDFLVFGESDEAHRVEGGNENLMKALVAAIKDKVNINIGHKLESVVDRDSKFELTFSQYENRGPTRTVKFDRMVSAIPFTMLREGKKLKVLEKLGLPEDKVKCITEYGYGTNAKVMYNFQRKFWRELSLKNQKGLTKMSNGGVVTDLPFNQVWETSRGQKGSAGILTNFFGGERGAAYFDSYKTDAVKELNQIFPGIAANLAAKNPIIQMHWPRHQFTRGSYSCPRPGQALSFIETAGRPELNDRLIFAGEHTSPDAPGYMSGGVQSGNIAARVLLGIKEEAKEEAPAAGGAAPEGAAPEGSKAGETGKGKDAA